MKKLSLLFVLTSLFTGCAWIGHGTHGSAQDTDAIPGVETRTARGTTGVSSGADTGPEITGSDLVAPR